MEQEAWSEGTPSPTIKSPIQQSISQVISPQEDSPGMMTYAIEDQQTLDYKKELDKSQPKVLIDDKDFKDGISENFKRSEEIAQKMSTGMNELNVPPAPPAPPAQGEKPALEVLTKEEAKPFNLLESLKLGKKLKQTKTKETANDQAGKVKI
jgi:hypothetical protein